MDVYHLGHGRYIDFVLVLVPDWYLLHLYMIGKMHRTLGRGTNLVRSQNVLAMLPNQGLDSLKSGLCFLHYKKYSIKSHTYDSLAHTLFACRKHFSNGLSHGIRRDDGGLRRSTTFLTPIEIEIRNVHVRTN